MYRLAAGGRLGASYLAASFGTDLALPFSFVSLSCSHFTKGDQAMPVLDQERVSTRSALRYRPLPVTDQARPGPVTARRSRIRADSSAPAARAIPDELDVEEKETPPPRRRSTAPAPSRKTTQPPASRASRHLHPLLFGGVGLMAFVLLWVGVTPAFIWGNNILNGLRYGYPRTFQMDAMVGHQDSASAPS